MSDVTKMKPVYVGSEWFPGLQRHQEVLGLISLWLAVSPQTVARSGGSLWAPAAAGPRRFPVLEELWTDGCSWRWVPSTPSVYLRTQEAAVCVQDQWTGGGKGEHLTDLRWQLSDGIFGDVEQAELVELRKVDRKLPDLRLPDVPLCQVGHPLQLPGEVLQNIHPSITVIFVQVNHVEC